MTLFIACLGERSLYAIEPQTSFCPLSHSRLSRSSIVHTSSNHHNQRLSVIPTPQIMIPQLKPELCLEIARHVKRVFPVYDGAIGSVENAINADQDTLLNLMLSSKVGEFSSTLGLD